MEGAATPAAAPAFRAVTGSTRPLFQLLRCINFTNKIHVEIGEDAIKFAAEQGRVMQGIASWNKSLFTNYQVKLPVDEDGETTNIQFLISLPAFLEVLQIFGAADAAARQAKADSDPYRSNLRNYRPDAFSHQTLGMPGTCSLIYNQVGESFRIELDEAGVSTTCNLTTYMAESLDDIPFDLENVSFKIIMLSRWLLDSLGEIAPTSPERLTIKASRRAPYLQLSSHGPLGTSSVDFAGGRELLETLQIHGEWRQTFKFDLIKTASEAMRIAKKVSMRGDAQGVLSLQLMVELDGGGHNFLDFRFVPYATPDDEENRVEGAADEEG